MNVQEHIKKIQTGSEDLVKETQYALDQTKALNEQYHYFNTISEGLALESAKNIQNTKQGKLSGVFVSVKDNICIKDVETTAGSRILDGYKPVFDATVIQKIKEEGAIILGHTAQDEFGFGSFSVNIGLGKETPLNPNDQSRVCGGSSGGSAGFTRKTTLPHISLGQSTGGSIVCPASFCGVVGLCPTYGLVSRNGLIDYGNSLDKIGPIAKTVEDAALMLDVIAGPDKQDSTSVDRQDEYLPFLNKEIKGMKVGIIKETLEGIDDDVKQIFNDTVDQLKKKGAQVTELSLPLVRKYGISTYYLIAVCESSTNLAKYCGMRYGKHEELKGNFNEYFTKVRSNHFGDEVKRRIILGTFARQAGYRDAFYIKAMKVRTLLINEYKQAFENVDVLMSPTMPIVAPKFEEVSKLSPLDHYNMDQMTVGPNLAGLPHISVNAGSAQNMPVGVMFIADHFQEGNLIQISKEVHQQ